MHYRGNCETNEATGLSLILKETQKQQRPDMTFTPATQTMAAGVPVVSTNVGGVSDILEDGKLGYVTPPGNAEKLAEAVIKILDGQVPDIHKAQETSLAFYDVTRRAEELNAFYTELLTQKNPTNGPRR